ncbi:hypothetical protein FM109_12680 [Vibrio casei]|nr:hypothetical protein FM109_12680 [Vibrio casei]
MSFQSALLLFLRYSIWNEKVSRNDDEVNGRAFSVKKEK